MTAAGTVLTATPTGPTSLGGPDFTGSVLAFERGGLLFCCPADDLREIVEAPALTDPLGAPPLVAGVLLHGEVFVPVIDPAAIFDHPARGDGDVLLIQRQDGGGGPGGGLGRVAGVLADTILGFRRPSAVSPAPWVPPGRMCRAAAALEPEGRAFLLAADGLDDVPTAMAATAQTSADALIPAAGVPAAGPGGAPLSLVYTIGGRPYASSYADVRRILYRQTMVRIPGGAGPLRHAVEMSGAIVPVVDLATPPADGGQWHFVVLGSPLGPLALRVDTIERPLPLRRDEADPGWFPAPGVDGVGRMEDQAISLVTGPALLRDLIGAEVP